VSACLEALRDQAQRAVVVLDVLEHVPQDHAPERARHLGERLPRDGDAGMRLQRPRGVRYRIVGKVDGRAAPSLGGEVRGDVAPAAADFEERPLHAVALDEAVEAEEHVALEWCEVRHRGEGEDGGAVRARFPPRPRR